MSVPVNQQGFSSSSLGGWMLESSCTGPQRYSHSVYGGAGCFGTCISQGSYFNSACSAGGDWPVFNGGKLTMQNLNDRLACYLEKVRSLENKNRELQINIDELRVKTTYITKDYANYFSLIRDLKAKIQCWQQNICVVNNQTSAQLSCHQSVITALETELQQMKTCMTEHRIKYDTVLEIKARLQSEIAEYRRLLEGEGYEHNKALIIKQVTEEVEEQKPHIEKRVKTIVEELVNGQVVSSSVDTQVHTVQ